MLNLRRPNVCNGSGECFRRYTKYYYYKHDDIICIHNCERIPCRGCKIPYPQYHYDLFTSGLCYDCNKEIHIEEFDTDEEMMRSDASLCSGRNSPEGDELSQVILKQFDDFMKKNQEEFGIKEITDSSNNQTHDR